jgi:integrase
MVKSHMLCQLFIEENRWNYEDSTIEVFKQAFAHFIEAVGYKRIDRIAPIDGERFKGWCMDNGKAKTSANMWIRAISRVFTWSVEEKNILADNPLRRTRQFRISREPVKFYEDWQVERMLRFAPDLRWKGIILCAWTTGLRRSAIMNLTFDNIRDGYIYVEAKRKTGKTWPWESKTKESRKVPMVDQLKWIIELLGCHYPFLTHRRYAHLLYLQSAGLLTATQRKRPEDNFRRTFVGIQKRAFGRQIGDFHRFRKTYITNMVEQLPEHIVMSLTGHKCRKTLTHYTGGRESFYEQARKIASDRLKKGTLLKPESPRKEVG